MRYVEFRKKEAMELVKAREEKDRQADRQAATASITEASRFTPDADRILHYDQSIVLFKKQLDDINAKYQDKTGLIGKAQDWLGETTGGW